MLRKIELTPPARTNIFRRFGFHIAIILAVIIVILLLWEPQEQESGNILFSLESMLAIKNNGMDEDITLNQGEIDNQNSSMENTDDSVNSDVTEQVINEYIISSGDTLTKVLQSFDISYQDVLQLTKKYPNLEKGIRPGQLITWTTDDEGQLETLVWSVNRKETRTYVNSGEDGFQETIEVQQGEWREFVITGELGQQGNSSFIGSAQAAGLSVTERYNAARFLEYQISFKSLRKGDKFSVLVEREFVNDEHVSSRLLAAKIISHGHDNYAIYFEKYRGYYDDSGKPLAEGFLRTPWLGNKSYRISSHFNPVRLHPITKRVSPHNGTDFAMPVGTPVIAAGDGEIMASRYSPTAGYYIAIQHGRQYTTRYLHLSKLAVKVGQIVKRGDVIGYSGNTGRSTGAHLHYEFHINNRPVNPIKVDLPRPEGLTGDDLVEFNDYLLQIKQKFNDAENQANQAKEKAKNAIPMVIMQGIGSDEYMRKMINQQILNVVGDDVGKIIGLPVLPISTADDISRRIVKEQYKEYKERTPVVQIFMPSLTPKAKNTEQQPLKQMASTPDIVTENITDEN